MTPDQHTNQEFQLDVSDGHQLYVHDWGNPKAATPVLLLHGGPGGGTSNKHKLLFDPAQQRVIFHDQRGSGRSLPYGSLANNTTDHLIADISRIADELGIARFVLCGGSWGSTLALAYAIANPQRVAGLVLDGVLTASKAELAWIDQGGFRTFFPDAWQAYLDATPPAHHHDPSRYHFGRILGDDPAASAASGIAYQTLEGALVGLDDRQLAPTDADMAGFDPAGIRIEVHYLAQQCFLPPDHIIEQAGRLTMPVRLVQGRYDMVCPPQAAYELAKRLPDGQLYLTTSGHKAEHETWNLKRSLLLQLTA